MSHLPSIPTDRTHKQFWTEFFQLYKENPCLWDQTSPTFLKRKLKTLALNVLLEKYWEIDGLATVETIRRRLASFRAGFVKEHKRGSEVALNGASFTSKLWYYNYVTFLKNYGENNFRVMRAKCAMYGCNAATYNDIGRILNFHRFPRNTERLNQWKKIVRNPCVQSKAYKMLWLCSLHFTKESYRGRFLKRDAVPTLKIPSTDCENKNLSRHAKGSDLDSISAPLDGSSDKIVSDQEKVRAVLEEEIESSTETCKVKKETGIDKTPKEMFEPMKEAGTEKIAMEICDVKKETTINKKPLTCAHEDITQPNFEIKTETLNDDDGDEFASTHFKRSEVKDTEKLQEWDESECSDSVIELTHGTVVFNDRENSTQPDTFIAPTSSPEETIHSNLPTITGVTSIIEDKPTNPVIHQVVDKTDIEDDCSTFAAHVKMRMRKFSPSQKTIAQKLISDVMFMADTQQLQMNSSVVSPLSHHLMPHTMIPIGPVAIPHGSTWTTMMPTVSVTSEAPVNMTTVSMASSLPATKAPSLKRSNNGAIKTTKPVENSSLL